MPVLPDHLCGKAPYHLRQNVHRPPCQSCMPTCLSAKPLRDDLADPMRAVGVADNIALPITKVKNCFLGVPWQSKLISK